MQPVAYMSDLSLEAIGGLVERSHGFRSACSDLRVNVRDRFHLGLSSKFLGHVADVGDLPLELAVRVLKRVVFLLQPFIFSFYGLVFEIERFVLGYPDCAKNRENYGEEDDPAAYVNYIVMDA